MKRFELNDSLKTGIRMIDTHHRELIAAINDLADAIEKGEGTNAVKKILTFLQFYAEWHFEHEEKCAHQHECALRDINKQAHTKFLETVKHYKTAYSQSQGNEEEIAREIHEELSQWLVNHIQGIDVKLGQEILAATNNNN
jgi:hemerythrin